MKKISIIVAIAQNYAIGLNNELLWHISDDLKRFKKITIGHTVIMGRNTYLSLPHRPLSGRTNIVITDDKKETFEGCLIAHSIDEALQLANATGENFIIGGGMVYSQFMPIADKLYLTKVYHDFEADTFFPEIDFSQWKLIEQEDFKAGEKCEFPFSYLIYERIR